MDEEKILYSIIVEDVINVSDETLSPVNAPKLSTIIDFPEPVSPVKRFNPLANSSSISSISAMFLILRSESIIEFRFSVLVFGL
jgi:hypothetical protein